MDATHQSLLAVMLHSQLWGREEKRNRFVGHAFRHDIRALST